MVLRTKSTLILDLVRVKHSGPCGEKFMIVTVLGFTLKLSILSMKMHAFFIRNHCIRNINVEG